ncbi:hypothetical protein B6E66_06010 [Streptomyces maremycinicus]|nr:hypothetical protein B6E66_06010 [Streptomyces sp. B9173]
MRGGRLLRVGGGGGAGGGDGGARGSTPVRAVGHCPRRSRVSESCANRLYGAATIALRASARACSLEPPPGACGIWASEACRRTLGGMGLGR